MRLTGINKVNLIYLTLMGGFLVVRNIDTDCPLVSGCNTYHTTVQHLSMILGTSYHTDVLSSVHFSDQFCFIHY